MNGQAFLFFQIFYFDFLWNAAFEIVPFWTKTFGIKTKGLLLGSIWNQILSLAGSFIGRISFFQTLQAIIPA